MAPIGSAGEGRRVLGNKEQEDPRMKDTPQHLKTLEEIEREGLPGLVEVLREEGLDGVRYVSSWHSDYSPPLGATGHRGAEEEGLGDGGEDREDTLHCSP